MLCVKPSTLHFSLTFFVRKYRQAFLSSIGHKKFDIEMLSHYRQRVLLFLLLANYRLRFLLSLFLSMWNGFLSMINIWRNFSKFPTQRRHSIKPHSLRRAILNIGHVAGFKCSKVIMNNGYYGKKR